MTVQFKKAVKEKLNVKIGLAGPAGSGKTYSALRMATGLGGRIALIDTERESGKVYADKFDYDILCLGQPYSPERYIEAIKAAEAARYSVIIVDGMSHAWSGEGGILDIHESVRKRVKNSFTAWAEVTPRQNRLVDSIVAAQCHVIATFRSKQEYVITENSNGKKAPVKVGLAPIQRDGFDYEFSVFFEMLDKTAVANKDRTGLFPFTDPFEITEVIGQKIHAWANSGATPEKTTTPPVKDETTTPPAATTTPPANEENETWPPANNAQIKRLNDARVARDIGVTPLMMYAHKLYGATSLRKLDQAQVEAVIAHLSSGGEI